VTILLWGFAHYLQSHIAHLVHHPYATHFNAKLVCCDFNQSALIITVFSRKESCQPSLIFFRSFEKFDADGSGQVPLHMPQRQRPFFRTPARCGSQSIFMHFYT
jgi:hypothetical protein